MSEEIKYQLKADDLVTENIIVFRLDREKKVINISAVPPEPPKVEKDNTNQLGSKENIIAVRYDDATNTYFLYAPESVNEDDLVALINNDITEGGFKEALINLINQESQSAAASDIMSYGTIDEMSTSTSKFFVLIDEQDQSYVQLMRVEKERLFFNEDGTDKTALNNKNIYYNASDSSDTNNPQFYYKDDSGEFILINSNNLSLSLNSMNELIVMHEITSQDDATIELSTKINLTSGELSKISISVEDSNSDEFMYGDVDDSGSITNKDIGLLMSYINAKDNITINEKAADVNCDGYITDEDFNILMRYVNEFDLEQEYLNNLNATEPDENYKYELKYDITKECIYISYSYES